MKKGIVILLLFMSRHLSAGGIYFPLHVGDNWDYTDNSLACEGTSFLNTIGSDTVFNGKTYYVFSFYSIYGAHFARSDSNRVYAYDTSKHGEYVVFDFAAKPGDTVSVVGTRTTIALGSLQFAVSEPYYNWIYTIKDSIGVISSRPLWMPCNTILRSAFINGKLAYPTSVAKPTASYIPSDPFLDQNYPNPFNPSTNFRFFLPVELQIKLDVLNDLGQQVASLFEGRKGAGWNEMTWNAQGMSSGAYFIRLRYEQKTIIRSALLMK
jgi:hypothetical protein